MSFLRALCYNEKSVPKAKDFSPSEVKYMKKTPLLIFIATLVFAVAGFFLRLSQLSTELLPNGFLAEGSFLHIVLLVLTAVLLVGLALLLRPLEQRESCENAFSSSPVPDVLLLVAALGLLVGSLMSFLAGSELPVASVSAPRMISLLNQAQAPLGLVSAGCVAAFAICRLLGKKPSAIFFMLVSIWLTVRLIVSFQNWNTDPSIHVYCYPLLASVCVMLGSFQLAGFSFGKGKRRISLFWCLSALFFCGISVADSLRGENSAQLVFALSLLLTMVASSSQLLFCPAVTEES